MNLESANSKRLGLVLVAIVILDGTAATQQPSPAPVPAAGQLSAYRPPALALVQPAAGGSLPSDKPVLVFRFAAGEPNDPIDAQSFAVGVDGADRTARFQVTATEAWGTLADLGETGIAAGPHQVSARICSARGACAEVSATVVVIEAPRSRSAPGGEPSSDRRRTLMDAVVAAIRKLLEP